MKRLLLIAVFFKFSVVALAQDMPVAEVFGGYSFLQCNFDEKVPCNLNGWGASVAIIANNWLGVVADFSGHYGVQKGGNVFDTRVHSFVFGPRFSGRWEKWGAFYQTLLGVTHQKRTMGDFSMGGNYFALALGIGINRNLNDRITICPFLVKYIYNRSENDKINHGKYSAGFFFKLGKR